MIAAIQQLAVQIIVVDDSAAPVLTCPPRHNYSMFFQYSSCYYWYCNSYG
jgi:hypothetical protein